MHLCVSGYVCKSKRCLPAKTPLFTRTTKAFKDEKDITSQGVPLDADTGEQYLMHGSNALAIESILNHSFDVKRAKQGWYGRAVYFADDPSKSDQYARSDGGARVHGLLERLGIEESEWKSQAMTSGAGKQEVFFMFVSRVALGCTAKLNKLDFDKNESPHDAKEKLFFDAAQPPVSRKFGNSTVDQFEMRMVKNLNRKYHSVAVDAYSAGNQAMRFREITVYRDVVAKVTHLIAYVRAGEADVATKEQMGEVWKAKGDPFGE